MNIGFIGCGNMATAIIKGITSKDSTNAIYAYDCYEPALDSAVKNYSVKKVISEAEVVKKSDIIFLAIKPNNLADVLGKISPIISYDKMLISICAGKTLEYIAENLGKDCKTVRVMPNINAKVGEAISAYCFNELVTPDDCKDVESLLDCIGKFISLDEKYFPVFGVIGGCAPAFSYMFIDELARAGVKNGLKKDEALRIAAQTVYGSAKMILESDEHPYKLIDNVCSPGGTTIEGVLSLQKDGFDKAIHNAVQASVDKDSKL